MSTIGAPTAALCSVIVSVALVGCAGLSQGARPADFPFHASVDRFELHWRIVQENGVVRAEGLVETTLSRVLSAMLELRGVDKNGRVVSRTLGSARWGFQMSGLAPFAVEVRRGGEEDRFEIGIQSFTVVPARR